MSSVRYTTSSTGAALAGGIANHIMVGGTTSAAKALRLIDGSNSSGGTLRITLKVGAWALNMPAGGLDFGTGLFVASTGPYGGVNVLMQ
jgi:hypothetical protein